MQFPLVLCVILGAVGVPGQVEVEDVFSEGCLLVPFRVDKDGGVGVAGHALVEMLRDENNVVSCEQPAPHTPQLDGLGHERIVVRYQQNRTHHLVLDVLDDPSYLHVCPPLDEKAESHGHQKMANRVVLFEAAIPLSVVEEGSVTVVVGGHAQSVSLTAVHRRLLREADLLQSNEAVEKRLVHRTLQSSGPITTQNNIVFLSSGYLESQEQLFFDNCDEAIQYMQQPPGAFANSIAFARYASVLNVFGVFQPSDEEGATHPSSGLVVKNNLDCTYGSPLDGNPERMLACDMEKVSDLASTSPAGAYGKTNVVVVTLVNAPHYGGAGMFHRRASEGTVYRQASFFNGYLGTQGNETNFASLFFHEVGHAYANLFDEYSFGSSSRGQDTVSPNCAFSSSSVKWSGWIQEGSVDPFRSVSKTPDTVCGYTDYYKPSTDCIMDRLKASRMCPVCREASVLAFYEDGMALTNPRCPQEGEVVLLEPGEHIILNVNKKLQSIGAFAVSWTYQSKQVSTGVALKVQACDSFGASCASGNGHMFLTSGEHTFDLSVEDLTDWVRNDNRLPSMKVATTFTVKTIARGERATLNATRGDITGYNCLDQRLIFEINDAEATQHYSYCSGEANKTCKINYTTSAYEQTEDFSDFADTLEGLIFGIVGACVGGLLLLFLLIWCCLARENSKRAKCIFKEERPTYLECIRWTMVGTALVCMLAAAGAITAGMLYYKALGPIGRILIFAALGVALLLFIIAFVGFTAAWYRSKCALTINGILLLKCFILVLGWTIFAFIFHNTVDEADSWSQRWLENIWVWLAEEHDKMLCSLENTLECSGYFTTCQRLQSEKYCPQNCESTHSKAWAAQACEPLIKGKFNDNFSLIVALSIVMCCLMVMAVVFNFILRRSIGRFKKQVKKNFKQRESYKHKRFSTTPAANEINQSFISQGGREAAGAETLLALIGALSLEERQKLKEEFSRVDRDGDGTLDPKEFRFFIKTALMYKAEHGEVEALFSIIDKDRTGKISLAEFIDMLGLEREAHPGALSPMNSPTLWAEAFDADNDPYYYHRTTRETTRELWETTHDAVRNVPLYRNILTNETSYTPPPKNAPPTSPAGPQNPLIGHSSHTPGASPWKQLDHPTEGRYYWNRTTGAVQYDRPADFDASPSFGSPPLLSPKISGQGEWVEVKPADNTGEPYWWHRATGETSYERPAGVSPAAISPDTTPLLGASPALLSPSSTALSPHDPTKLLGNTRTSLGTSRGIGWTTLKDDNGADYFWNRETGESTYTRPEEALLSPGGGGGGSGVGTTSLSASFNINGLLGRELKEATLPREDVMVSPVKDWLRVLTPPPTKTEEDEARVKAIREEFGVGGVDEGSQSQTYSFYDPEGDGGGGSGGADGADGTGMARPLAKRRARPTFSSPTEPDLVSPPFRRSRSPRTSPTSPAL